MARKQLLLLFLLLALLLGGCQRNGGGAEEDSPLGEGVPPSPTLPAEEGSGGFTIPGFGEDTGQEGAEPGTIPTIPALAGRFSNLRFATSGDGFPQTEFPYGTEEVYAIWDYDGMSPNDIMERLWYHNGEVYLERRENWDFLKYGFSGTVRDVYHYNYEDGSVFPGQWRVEIYLNGELQLSGEFTVASAP